MDIEEEAKGDGVKAPRSVNISGGAAQSKSQKEELYKQK